MVVQNGIHDPHSFFYSGGVLNLENALVATVGLVNFEHGLGALLRASTRLQHNLRRATRGLPLREAYPAGTGGRVAFLDEALDHPDPTDPYWAGADLGPVAERHAVPTALVAGWSDVCLDQTLRQWKRLRTAGCPSSLLIGPWTHTSTLGPGLPEVFRESLAWLRAHLCDDPSGLRAQPVRVNLGDNWRDLADWPGEGIERRWYLADGRLAPEPTETGPVGFRVDPADPTPSAGGPLLSQQAGPRRNDRREARPDVLTFSTAPLSEPVELLGPVAVDLLVTAGHTDLFARLCDVDPRGRSVNVCDGVLRLTPTGSGPVAVMVDLDHTAHRFAAGHRLRLQLSGAPHPRYARNPGTGEPDATATTLVATELTVHQPSAVRALGGGRTP